MSNINTNTVTTELNSAKTTATTSAAEIALSFSAGDDEDAVIASKALKVNNDNDVAAVVDNKNSNNDNDGDEKMENNTNKNTNNDDDEEEDDEIEQHQHHHQQKQYQEVEQHQQISIMLQQICRCCGKLNKDLYPLFQEGASETTTTPIVTIPTNSDVLQTNTFSTATPNTVTASAKGAAGEASELLSLATPATLSTSTAATSSSSNSIVENEAVQFMLNSFTKNNHKMDIIIEETEIWQLQIRRDDGLPQDICRQCTAQFYMVHKFRRKCLKVQARLKRIWEREQQQTPQQRQQSKQKQQEQQEQEDQQNQEQKQEEPQQKEPLKHIEKDKFDERMKMMMKMEVMDKENLLNLAALEEQKPIVEGDTLVDFIDEEKLLKAHKIYKQSLDAKCRPRHSSPNKKNNRTKEDNSNEDESKNQHSTNIVAMCAGAIVTPKENGTKASSFASSSSSLLLSSSSSSSSSSSKQEGVKHETEKHFTPETKTSNGDDGCGNGGDGGSDNDNDDIGCSGADSGAGSRKRKLTQILLNNNSSPKRELMSNMFVKAIKRIRQQRDVGSGLRTKGNVRTRSMTKLEEQTTTTTTATMMEVTEDCSYDDASSVPVVVVGGNSSSCTSSSTKVDEKLTTEIEDEEEIEVIAEVATAITTRESNVSTTTPTKVTTERIKERTTSMNEEEEPPSPKRARCAINNTEDEVKLPWKTKAARKEIPIINSDTSTPLDASSTEKKKSLSLSSSLLSSSSSSPRKTETAESETCADAAIKLNDVASKAITTETTAETTKQNGITATTSPSSTSKTSSTAASNDRKQVNTLRRRRSRCGGRRHKKSKQNTNHRSKSGRFIKREEYALIRRRQRDDKSDIIKNEGMLCCLSVTKKDSNLLNLQQIEPQNTKKEIWDHCKEETQKTFQTGDDVVGHHNHSAVKCDEVKKVVTVVQQQMEVEIVKCQKAEKQEISVPVAELSKSLEETYNNTTTNNININRINVDNTEKECIDCNTTTTTAAVSRGIRGEIESNGVTPETEKQQQKKVTIDVVAVAAVDVDRNSGNKALKTQQTPARIEKVTKVEKASASASHKHQQKQKHPENGIVAVASFNAKHKAASTAAEPANIVAGDEVEEDKVIMLKEVVMMNKEETNSKIVPPAAAAASLVMMELNVDEKTKEKYAFKIDDTQNKENVDKGIKVSIPLSRLSEDFKRHLLLQQSIDIDGVVIDATIAASSANIAPAATATAIAGNIDPNTEISLLPSEPFTTIMSPNQLLELNNKENELHSNNDENFHQSAVMGSNSSNAVTARDKSDIIGKGAAADDDKTIVVMMLNNDDEQQQQQQQHKTMSSEQSGYFGFQQTFDGIPDDTIVAKVNEECCTGKVNELFAELQRHCESSNSNTNQTSNDNNVAADINVNDDVNNDDDDPMASSKVDSGNSLLDADEMNYVESTLNGILNEMQDQHIYTPVSDFLEPSDYSPLTPGHSLHQESASPADDPATSEAGSIYVPSPGGGILMTVNNGSPYAEHHHHHQQQQLHLQQHQQQQQQQQANTICLQQQTQAADDEEGDATTQRAINEFFGEAFNNYEQVFTDNDANTVPTNLIGFQNDIPCFETMSSAAPSSPPPLALIKPTKLPSLPLPQAMRSGRTLTDLIQLPSSVVQNMQLVATGTTAANQITTPPITLNSEHQHQPIFVPNAAAVTPSSGAAAAAGVSAAAAATLPSNLQLELSELLDELQQPTTIIEQHQHQHHQQQQQQQQHHQHEQQQQQQLLNTTYNSSNGTYTTHLQPILDANAAAKLQFITLQTPPPSVNNSNDLSASSYHLHHSHSHPHQFAQQTLPSLQHTQLQWSAAGGLEAIKATTETLSTPVDGTTTTTTTYYINATELYQTNQQPAQLQQTTTHHYLELDNKRTLDGNENYLETNNGVGGLVGVGGGGGGAATVNNQQIMIVIPHSSSGGAAGTATLAPTCAMDMNNPVASASNPHQAPLQIYSTATTPPTISNDLHTALHEHHQQSAFLLQQHQQRNNINPTTEPSTTNVFMTSTPLPEASPTAIQYAFSSLSPILQHQSPGTPPMATQSLSPQSQTGQAPANRISLNCRFCHTRPRFTNNLEYSKHIIEMHPAEAPFNCPHCPMLFNGRTKRQQHITEQHFSRRFSCGQCGQAFPAQRALDLHLQRYHALVDTNNVTQQRLVLQQPQQHHQQQQQHQHQQQLQHQEHIQQHGVGVGGVDVEDVQLHMNDEGLCSNDGPIETINGSGPSDGIMNRPDQTKKPTRILCCPDCGDLNSTEHHGHHSQEQQQHCPTKLSVAVHDELAPSPTAMSAITATAAAGAGAITNATTVAASISPTSNQTPPTSMPTTTATPVTASTTIAQGITTNNCNTNSPMAGGAHITLPSPEQSEPDSTSTSTLRQFRRRRISPSPSPSPSLLSSSSPSLVQSTMTTKPPNNYIQSAQSQSPSSSPSSSTMSDAMQLGELRSTHNCIYCTARFTNDIALRKHHQLAHRDQNTTMPFVCSICNRGFRTRTALQRHMESHNSEGRPFECDTCHVRFPRRSQLRLHIITVHILTKPHTCEECGKQFGTESALKTHIKFHGERLFECPVCNISFLLKRDLRKHIRQRHTGEKFYKCDLCPDSFLHYSRYSAHISGHFPPINSTDSASTIITTKEDIEKMTTTTTSTNTTTSSVESLLKVVDSITQLPELIMPPTPNPMETLEHEQQNIEVNKQITPTPALKDNLINVDPPLNAVAVMSSDSRLLDSDHNK